MIQKETKQFDMIKDVRLKLYVCLKEYTKTVKLKLSQEIADHSKLT